MANPFGQTLRSLEGDRGGWTWLAVAVALLAAWGVWMVGARVGVYEVASRAWVAGVPPAGGVVAGVGGRVVAVRMRLGQRVAAGQVVAEIDGGEGMVRLGAARRRLKALEDQAAAVRREIVAEVNGAGAERAAALAGVDEAAARMREAAAAAGLAEAQAVRQERLLAAGLVPAAEAARTGSLADQGRAAVAALAASSRGLLHRQRGAASGRRARREELERVLAGLRGDSAAVRAEAESLAGDLGLRRVRAPFGGWIGAVSAVGPGELVAPGAWLGSVVPDGEPAVIAEFPVEALARLRPGQLARVRLPTSALRHSSLVLAASVAVVAGQRGRHPADLPQPGRDPADLTSTPRAGTVRVELLLLLPARPGSPGPRPPLLRIGLPVEVEVEVARSSPAGLLLGTIRPGGSSSGRRGGGAPQ
jgi:multidrug resistance efflux pump